MLEAIDARLPAYAGNGVRLLLRFVYNMGETSNPNPYDAPIDRIITHVDQLAPIRKKHKDLIVTLQAGFIGKWGEWHTSPNGNDNPTAHRIVLDQLLGHFRGLFPIDVRYPAH